MHIDTKAVHAGDRKPAPRQVPVTTPIHTAASYFTESMEELDRIFARDQAGYCYARYGNPTTAALEEQVTALENGHGTLACASGMAAIQMALLAALEGRPRAIVAAEALYGATVVVLTKVLAPLGVRTTFVDACDVAAVERAVSETPPGCVLAETISNPLLRVAPVDRLAEIARAAGAPLVVDNTFATPVLVRPLELGAAYVVHSVTKFLAGHGDVLGGTVTTDAARYEGLRALARACGPVLGPFEAYLTMRGVKTLPLRIERQCATAGRIAGWLNTHRAVERVYFPGDPAHPDAGTVRRFLPDGLYGALVSFELKGAGRAEIFRFLDRLKLVVRATSLGDVHSLILCPAMSSHREVPAERRARMGIRDNLVRLSCGIEAAEDILADLEQALCCAEQKET